MKSGSKKDEGGCVKCGTCNTVCPVYLTTGNEIHTPRGKQHLNSRIKKGEASSHLADIFSKCLLCGACLEVCPRGLDTPQLVMNVRSELPRLTGLTFLKYVSRKALLHPLLFSGLSRLGSAANTLLGEFLPQESGLRLRLMGFDQKVLQLPAVSYMDKVKAEMVAEAEQQVSKKPALSFYTGCFANHLQPEIAESTQSLLSKTIGSKAKVPLAQTCCGMAAMAAGRKEEALALAKKNIIAFETDELPVLVSCSSCYFQLKSYKELFADDPEWLGRACRFTDRLREFSTFFLESITKTAEAINYSDKAGSSKVAYHDPCHLRFRLHITEEPRQLLKLFPGVEIQELPGGPQCCGQGGLFQLAHPDLAGQVHKRLQDDFGKLSADTVLTACSGCLLQWQLGFGADASRGRAEHLAVFLARLMR